MKKMFLLFSHKLNEEQRISAKETLGVEKFICMPEELAKAWGAIPPEPDSIDEYLDIFRQWLREEAGKEDVVLISGDFGASYKMVNWCFANALLPVYVTTKRIMRESEKSDGCMEKVSIFKHVRFRRY